MPYFEVIVGNLGIAYHGHSENTAIKVYDEYVRMVQLGSGRASGESVYMFKESLEHGDELVKEFHPPVCTFEDCLEVGTIGCGICRDLLCRLHWFLHVKTHA